jgi:hypothetical protein
LPDDELTIEGLLDLWMTLRAPARRARRRTPISARVGSGFTSGGTETGGFYIRVQNGLYFQFYKKLASIM